MTAFRNDIVHRGVIPSPEDAVVFGDAVLNVVRPVLRLLRTKYQDSFQLLNVQVRSAALRSIDLRVERPVEYSLAMALREVGHPLDQPRDVSSYLQELSIAR